MFDVTAQNIFLCIDFNNLELENNIEIKKKV